MLQLGVEFELKDENFTVRQERSGVCVPNRMTEPYILHYFGLETGKTSTCLVFCQYEANVRSRCRNDRTGVLNSIFLSRSLSRVRHTVL